MVGYWDWQWGHLLDLHLVQKMDSHWGWTLDLATDQNSDWNLDESLAKALAQHLAQRLVR